MSGLFLVYLANNCLDLVAGEASHGILYTFSVAKWQEGVYFGLGVRSSRWGIPWKCLWFKVARALVSTITMVFFFPWWLPIQWFFAFFLFGAKSRLPKCLEFFRGFFYKSQLWLF